MASPSNAHFSTGQQFAQALTEQGCVSLWGKTKIRRGGGPRARLNWGNHRGNCPYDLITLPQIETYTRSTRSMMRLRQAQFVSDILSVCDSWEIWVLTAGGGYVTLVEQMCYF